MIRATWTGIAVSDNDRLSHGKQGRMFANKEYTAFKEAMAWQIRLALKPQRDVEKTLLGRVWVALRVDLPPRMDTTAVLKAVCDAIQLSGAVVNDRQIEKVVLERVGTSPRGHSCITMEIDSME